MIFKKTYTLPSSSSSSLLSCSTSSDNSSLKGSSVMGSDNSSLTGSVDGASIILVSVPSNECFSCAGLNAGMLCTELSTSTCKNISVYSSFL